MTEINLLIPIQTNQLNVGATLSSLNGSENLIIVIPGTGPVDRDGNVKELQANLYKELTDRLTGNGFATLRYDKPGVGQSTGDFNRIGLWDLVETVLGIVNYFKTSEQYAFKKIILLGHSEGTIIATLASERIQVNGLILIAGAGSALKSVMMGQNNHVIDEIANKKGLSGFLLNRMITKEKLIKKQANLFDKVNQSDEDFFKISGQMIQAKWLREHLKIDDKHVRDQLSALSVPFLIINGDKDLQIDAESLNALEKIKNDNMTMKIIPGMNHLLKQQIDDGSILKLKQIYKKLEKEPVSEALIKVVTRWLFDMERIRGVK